MWLQWQSHLVLWAVVLSLTVFEWVSEWVSECVSEWVSEWVGGGLKPNKFMAKCASRKMAHNSHSVQDWESTSVNRFSYTCDRFIIFCCDLDMKASPVRITASIVRSIIDNQAELLTDSPLLSYTYSHELLVVDFHWANNEKCCRWERFRYVAGSARTQQRPIDIHDQFTNNSGDNWV